MISGGEIGNGGGGDDLNSVLTWKVSKMSNLQHQLRHHFSISHRSIDKMRNAPIIKRARQSIKAATMARRCNIINAAAAIYALCNCAQSIRTGDSIAILDMMRIRDSASGATRDCSAAGSAPSTRRHFALMYTFPLSHHC